MGTNGGGSSGFEADPLTGDFETGLAHVVPICVDGVEEATGRRTRPRHVCQITPLNVSFSKMFCQVDVDVLGRKSASWSNSMHAMMPLPA